MQRKYAILFAATIGSSGHLPIIVLLFIGFPRAQISVESTG